LIGRLWYTYAVNPIKGDFSCTARSGIRIIQDGEIKNPGKPVRIVHNITNLLQNISAIGNNARNVLQWASLPSICPSVRVEDVKLTII
jgi:PmbA protein